MNFKAQLRDKEHSVALTTGEIIRTVVDGSTYEIEVTELSVDEYLLKAGTNIFRCRVDAKPDSPNAFAVALRGETYEVTILDPKRLRSAQASSAHDHGEAKIVSPMPGKVVRVLVEKGATVQQGTGVVVVEAMKMQNEMKSPKTGIIVSINAKEGATVNAGEVLVVIE